MPSRTNDTSVIRDRWRIDQKVRVLGHNHASTILRQLQKIGIICSFETQFVDACHIDIPPTKSIEDSVGNMLVEQESNLREARHSSV
jgi:hypothetical protein